jgi:hypothetical protein
MMIPAGSFSDWLGSAHIRGGAVCRAAEEVHASEQTRGGYGEWQITIARSSADPYQEKDSAASYAAARWHFACASIVSLKGKWASVPRSVLVAG